MVSQNICIVAGPCAVESEEQIHEIGGKIARIRDAVPKEYGIDFKLRGGAWKPRTKYYVRDADGEIVEKVFEGYGEVALKWLADVADRYDIPVVSELMSEMDLRYFQAHLKPERDYLQIGARNSQNFALLFIAGNTNFGVLLKNPQHGVRIDEAVGAMERLKHNREVVYCTRGQARYVSVNDMEIGYKFFIEELVKTEGQHADARNLNNIKAIEKMRGEKGFERVLFCHDPSHTWGGKNDLTRRKIGEYAVKALTQYGYDWIEVEVNDESKCAMCDKNQALVSSFNGLDWSKTYVGERPSDGDLPLSLVDIVVEAMKHRGKILEMSSEKIESDFRMVSGL